MIVYDSTSIIILQKNAVLYRPMYEIMIQLNFNQFS